MTDTTAGEGVRFEFGGCRVQDIAYTAFMMARQPNDEDGGPTDWFTDTWPAIKALIAAQPSAGAQGEGVEPEDVAWQWLNEQQDCSPADIDYSADQMVDAFMAGRASRDRTDAFRAALERIAADGEPYRNGYCQTDIAVDPALTAQEAQDAARAALAAAQPEGK